MDKLQKIREAVEWAKPKDFFILWHSDDFSHSVSEAAVHGWLSYLLEQLDHARGCAEDAWKKEDDLEEQITSLQQQLDAAQQFETRYGNLKISYYELERQLDTVKQENERLRKLIPKTHPQMLSEAFDALAKHKGVGNPSLKRED